MSDPMMKEVVNLTTGEVTLVPMTPEEIAAMEQASSASSNAHAQATFDDADDAERLALVAERSATDPAFAALADLALSNKGV